MSKFLRSCNVYILALILLYIWHDYRYWSKLLFSTTPTPWPRDQGHRLKNFTLKFYLTVLKILYFIFSTTCSLQISSKIISSTMSAPQPPPPLWSGFEFHSLIFYTPPHNSGGVLWFHVGCPCVCPSVVRPSVHPSVFRFRMITWINFNGFSPNLVYALILWRSGLGLLMGKFRQIFTEVSA